MKAGGSRWPLLLGRRAFRLLATGPAWLLFFAALSLTFALAGPDLPGGWLLRGAGYVGTILALGLCLSPFALIIALRATLRAVRRAVAMRACDLAVDAEGLRVVGGSAHGYTARWAELRHAGAIGMTAEGLRVHRADGLTLTVPAHGDPEERASLEALAATLGARAAAGAAARPPARRGPPGALGCTGCGAPLAPADRPTARCGYCGTEHRVPEEIAAKVRAMDAVAAARRGDERLLASLARQPGARVANLVAFTGGLVMMALAGITTMTSGAMGLMRGDQSGLPRLAGSGLLLAGLALIVLALVRRALSDRRAVRTLTLGFAPLEPARPGEPPACRSCFGPLPEPAGDGWLSRCVYCGASHVSLVDLRIEEAVVRRFSQGERGPEAELDACRRVRRGAAWRLGFGGALVAIGAAWLALTPGPPPEAPRAALVPFDEAPRRTLEPILAGPGAARVERVAELGNVTAVLVANATGGVDALIHEAGRIRRVRDPRGRVRPGDGEAFTPERPRYGEGWLDDAIVTEWAALPGGAFLAATRASREGHFRLRRVNPDGSSERLLDDARHPAVTPDGRLLAAAVLVRDRWQIAAGELATPASLQVVTRGEGQATLPAWSPDGRRVAFVGGSLPDLITPSKRLGQAQLWAVTPGSDVAEQLTAGGNLVEIAPVWTQRGVFVLARGRDPESRATSTAVWRVEPR